MTKSAGIQRISFIDQCKGIGIILMVYGHCCTEVFLANTNGAMAFSAWFSSFHMPLFFILGGCLLAYKQQEFIFPKTLIRKAERLLLPGLFFSLLTILMFFTVRLIARKGAIQYLTDSMVELITLRFQGAMWFLPCYFFAEIAFLLFMKRTLIKWQALAISALGFAAAVCANAINSALFRVSRFLMAICFIGVGYWLWQTMLSKMIQKQTGESTKNENNTGGVYF